MDRLRVKGAMSNTNHWVIAGGESGARHRHMESEWVEDIRDQCVSSDVPLLLQAVGRTHAQAERT